MAVTAKFIADFTSFNDAVSKAEQKLSGFQTGASKVEDALKRMGDSLVGKRVVQEAALMAKAVDGIGGVSKLTASNLERVAKTSAEAVDQLKRLGKDVPENIARIAKESAELAKQQENVAKSTDGASTSVATLVKGFVSAQAIIGAAKLAWSALTGEVERSVKAAADAEKSHAQVAAALRAQGTDIPSVVTAFQQYATALQKTTIYQDDAIESAEALLVTVGNVMPRDMEKALKATTELASGLGIDLNQAATLVAKAAEGNVTALKRVGVVVDETKAKQEGFGVVLDAITDKFGGQAAALAGTYEGRLTQLANTWNNVEESIGRVVTSNKTVLAFFDSLNTLIDSNTGELKDNATATNLVASAVINSVKAFSFVANAVDTVQLYVRGAIIGFRDMGAAIANIGITALKVGRLGSLATGDFAGAAAATSGIESLQKAVDELKARNAATTQSSIAFGNAIADVVGRADQLAAKLEKTRGQTVALSGATKQGADSADAAADVWSRHTKAVVNSGEAADKLKKILESVADINAKIAGAKAFDIERIGIKRDDVKVVEEYLKALEKVQEVNAKIAGAKAFDIEKIGIKTEDVAAIKAQLDLIAERASHSVRAIFTKAFQSFPELLKKALTGGGGLTGAVQAIFSDLGAGLGEKLFGGIAAKASNFLSKTFGTKITESLGSIIPGIGGVLGSLIGPLVGKISSAIGKLFGNNEEKKINPIRQAFVDAAGGLDELNKKAAAAGVTLKAMLDAKNPEQYKKAIDDLNAALQFQDDAMAKLDETVKKYGFTLEELGPALQRQNLDKQAQELYQDFKVLTGAGINVDTVIGRMGESINDFVHDALKTGQEIPAAMAPMLQRMVEMGQLTDENGNVITDLGQAGIHFSETMTQGFQKIVDAVQKLTDAITRGLGTAIANIPDPQVEGHVSWKVDDIPDGGFSRSPDSPIIPMASGGMGRVTKPTLFLVGEKGPEDFAASGANKSFGDIGGGVTVQVGDVYVTAAKGDDPEDLAAKFIDGIIRGGKTYGKFRTLVKAVA